jgi:hypothetical protein
MGEVRSTGRCINKSVDRQVSEAYRKDMSKNLHARIAAALGWTESETKSFSLIVRGRAVRPMELKLGQLCHGWGGKLLPMSAETYFALVRQEKEHGLLGYQKRFNEAPFSSAIGLFWKTKTVVYVPEALLDEGPLESPRASGTSKAISVIIHEMGHVFACRKPPWDSNEYQFLGWEYAVAKLIGMSREDWYHSIWNYAICQKGCSGSCNHRIDEFGMLLAAKRDEVIRQRLDAARKARIVDAKGRPLAIR